MTNFPTVDDMFRMRTLMAELYGDKLASRRVAMVSTDAGAEQLLKLYKEVYVLRGGGSGGTFRLFTDPVPAEAWLKEPPAA
ncbi:MAG: hypothetical protein FJX47_22320 [Alphaproteobacteria bacterium]|nr:hypothetical protein [Alphaproteobacteria bacterium]